VVHTLQVGGVRSAVGNAGGGEQPSPLQLTAKHVEAWYEHRALQMDFECGLLDNVHALVTAGLEKGVAGPLRTLAHDVECLREATLRLTPAACGERYEGLLGLSLAEFRGMLPLERIGMMLCASDERTVVPHLQVREFSPFLHLKCSPPPSDFVSESCSGLHGRLAVGGELLAEKCVLKLPL
jgi:hypothetical protein